MPISRRAFLATQLPVLAVGASALAQTALDEAEMAARIEAHRPSRLAALGKLPADLSKRIGATHVDGRYHLTSKPFLIEGAEKLIGLGTRLGKFWFDPFSNFRQYSFNSDWPACRTLLELARTPYFQQTFDLPFRVIILTTSAQGEQEIRQKGDAAKAVEAVTREYRELTEHLYRTYRDRDLTFVLQNWEGDWLLRGEAGAKWDPAPLDAMSRCERAVKWLKARQDGVNQGREAAPKGSKCRVGHAAEVNRVFDGLKGIPTMTRNVLPQVELDLVSYSAYDGLKSGPTLWKGIEEIRAHCRTGTMFGERAVYLGEIGIPENVAKDRIAERWDEFLGVALALDIPYVVHWELFCNEFQTHLKPPPRAPVKDGDLMRGFWLVKPDGSLSVSGKLLSDLWKLSP